MNEAFDMAARTAWLTEVMGKAKELEKAINALISTFNAETGCTAEVQQVTMMDGYKIKVKASI